MRAGYKVQASTLLRRRPRLEDPETGNSALHWLATALISREQAHAAAAQLLRSLASPLDINGLNQAGESPLAIAMGSAPPKRQKRLIFPHERKDGEYAAAYEKKLDQMLEMGASVQWVGRDGRDLLHVVAGRCLQDPDIWGNRSWEFATMACANSERLWKVGADPKKEDDEMRSPVDAEEGGTCMRLCTYSGRLWTRMGQSNMS